MNKSTYRVIAALICILVIVMVFAGCRKKKNAVKETTQVTEATQLATTETEIPTVEGVEIWDDVLEETEATEESTATTPTTTTTDNTKKPTTSDTGSNKENSTSSDNKQSNTSDQNETTSTTEAKQPTTKPEEETQAPTQESTEPVSDYEWYVSLSPEAQQDYYNSFSSPEAFFNWYSSAKSAYDAAQKEAAMTGSPSVDLGEIIKDQQ